MDIVKLPVGKQAAIDADCIRIEQTAEAMFKLTALPCVSALMMGSRYRSLTGRHLQASKRLRQPVLPGQQVLVSNG